MINPGVAQSVTPLISQNQRRREMRTELQRHPASPPKYHPEISVQRNKFYRAISLGLIVRPDKCSWCGTTEKPIRGHHPDYSKPFQVIWCCKSCHMKIHALSNGHTGLLSIYAIYPDDLRPKQNREKNGNRKLGCPVS